MRPDSAGTAGSEGESIERDDLIFGVFAYIDVTFGKIRDRYSMGEQWPADHEVRVLAHHIRAAFRVQDTLGPYLAVIPDRFEALGLYHPDDIADALANGYVLFREGKDPLPAFKRSYLPVWAILREMEEYEWRKPKENQGAIIARQAWHAKPGDRMFRYETLDRIGVMLIRGSHRVQDDETTCMTPTQIGVDNWNVRKKRYDDLGGSKAVIEGTLTWPPLGEEPDGLK
jgi:hypothetical protein